MKGVQMGYNSLKRDTDTQKEREKGDWNYDTNNNNNNNNNNLNLVVIIKRFRLLEFSRVLTYNLIRKLFYPLENSEKKCPPATEALAHCLQCYTESVFNLANWVFKGVYPLCFGCPKQLL